MSVQYDDLRHDCEPPKLPSAPNWAHDSYVVYARWRCPECGARWAYESYWHSPYEFYWEPKSRPSWRWRRAEAKRRASVDQGGEST